MRSGCQNTRDPAGVDRPRHRDGGVLGSKRRRVRHGRGQLPDRDRPVDERLHGTIAQVIAAIPCRPPCCTRRHRRGRRRQRVARVRGRTPGLPPQGVALHCGKSVWSRRRGTRGGGRRGLPRSVHKLLRLSMAGVPSAGRTRSPRCDAILTMKEDALGGFHA